MKLLIIILHKLIFRNYFQVKKKKSICIIKLNLFKNEFFLNYYEAIVVEFSLI